MPQRRTTSFFRDALVEAAAEHGLAIHAYVWMTNDVHLLASPEFEHSISKVFQSVGRRYVHYFNDTYQRRGTLWEGRYRATVNPVRAGMVAHPRDYPWSSYGFNALGAKGPNADWISPHRECRRLGRKAADWQAAYRQLFRAVISGADLSEIRACTHKGWALGGERFREQIEALGQKRAASKGVGRAEEG